MATPPKAATNAQPDLAKLNFLGGSGRFTHQRKLDQLRPSEGASLLADPHAIGRHNAVLVCVERQFALLGPGP